MEKLRADRVRGIGEYVAANCRELEVSRYAHLVGAGSAGDVVRRLREYQNSDGGFGGGLEPDFTLPESSPKATSVALQIVDEIRGEGCDQLIREAARYNRGMWEPSWQWGAYMEAWTADRQHWIGVLAVRKVAIPKAFGRIG